MDTKEKSQTEIDDEQLFKKIEIHNRNVNVVVSLTIIATMLIGVMAMRMYLMQANAQEVKSKIESEFEDDVKRFKQEIAEKNINTKSTDNTGINTTSDVKSHPTSSTNPSTHAQTKTDYKDYKTTEPPTQQSKFADLHVDINSADTAELRKLPGIGEKRALNIVKFRTSLGGFYSVDQLAEVYGMDAALVERLKKYLICKGDVAKIDINNTNPYKLWHPYLKGDLIKTLKNNLKSGKKYKSFEDIKAEEEFNEELNGKAERYLEFK